MVARWWALLLILLLVPIACGEQASSLPRASPSPSALPESGSPPYPAAPPTISGLAPTPEPSAVPGPLSPPAPAATPATAASAQVPRPKTVVLDPGHGGPTDVGAANHGVVEKHSNLDMVLRVEALLKAQGLRVVLTRRTDGRSVLYPADGPKSGFGASRTDLQARVDLANAEKGDLFISIHSNGSTDGGQRGVEVWYDPNRPFADRNRRLAELLLRSVLAELDSYGYRAVNRGLKDDTCFRVREGRCFPLFVLGPERETSREEVLRRGGSPEQLGFAPGQEVIVGRATQMPGALIELLFISNEADAAVLRDERGREAMARGIAQAVLEFFALDDGS